MRPEYQWAFGSSRLYYEHSVTNAAIYIRYYVLSLADSIFALMKISRGVPLLLLTFFLTSCFDRKREQTEIINTWRTYRTAFSNNIGKECSRYIDSASVKYYEHLLTLVRTADSTTVEQLRMDQKLAVLLARHTIPATQIAKLNGTDLFERLVDQGAGGGLSEAPNFEFLSVTPAQAEAQIIDSNGKRGLKVVFNKENGIWKVNLAFISGQLSKSDWQEVIKESGRTEHEFIYAILELANNIEPTNNVWHPL